MMKQLHNLQLTNMRYYVTSCHLENNKEHQDIIKDGEETTRKEDKEGTKYRILKEKMNVNAT